MQMELIRCRLTCTSSPEGERLAVVAEAVVVLAGHPDLVQGAFFQTGERVTSGVKIFPVADGIFHEEFGPLAVGIQRADSGAKRRHGRPRLGHPLQEKAVRIESVGRRFEVNRTCET